MKQLTCEMCGSTELVKQDGFFICQTCGTKYSVEEAKKMMLEGSSDIQGSVKVDTSDELKNLYVLARRAKADDNSENAQKYYEQIIVKDPSSWEANFYTTYYQSQNCKIGEIGLAASRITNSLDSTFRIIKENVADAQEQLKILKEVSTDLILLSNMLFNAYINHYNGIAFSIRTNYTNECVSICLRVTSILYTAGDTIERYFDPEFGVISASCWKKGVELHDSLFCNSVFKIFMDKEKTPQTMATYSEKAKKGEKAALKILAQRFSDQFEDTTDLIEAAMTDLRNYSQFNMEAKFIAITERLPGEKLGYLGAAFASLEKQDSEACWENVGMINGKTSNPQYKSYIEEILNKPRFADGNTLLIYASLAHKVTVVKELIDMGADVNLKNHNEETALWTICQYSNVGTKQKKEEAVEIARMLLAAGAEVNVVNKRGTALFNTSVNYEIIKQIKEKDPNIKFGKPSSQGCYVATCVYGSYDCPQVWTLRRYRDDTLGSTWYGRLFIRTYYAISPTLVKWFGNTNWFKKLWKGKLDRMVAKLQSNGVADTPYEDKNW